MFLPVLLAEVPSFVTDKLVKQDVENSHGVGAHCRCGDPRALCPQPGPARLPVSTQNPLGK